MSHQTLTNNTDQEAGHYIQPLPVLLLREKQAALVLAIGERTLWDLADSGEIPVVYVGRSKRYRVTDLQEWVRNRPTGKPESVGT